ncbi:MAG: magnesium transporter [Paracoccus sp. (in: a-proteobacteria)]|nr:magnesium transporter [Paracoccus sp. (in: a-proteobacteria)]
MTATAMRHDARSPENLGALADQIAGFLAEGRTRTAAAALGGLAAPDWAEIIENIAAPLRIDALSLLAEHDQAEVLGHLRADVQDDLARAMAHDHLARLMSAMSHDERADLWKRLSPELRDALSPAMARAEREDMRRLSAYPEDTAGAVMTSDYATIRPDMLVGEALESLRVQARDAETIYTAYVVDARHRLLGVVSLRDLLVTPDAGRIERLMQAAPVACHATDDREDAARLIARYDLIALPVLDEAGRLVGIVTADDAMDVAEAEATEDFYKGSTIQPIEDSLAHSTLATLYRARIFWLVLLVFGNIFSGAGIAAFEDVIAAHMTLLFFLPLLIASGGNAGAQSATLTVRALATGDVRQSDFARLLLRELVVALGLGLTMAAAVSLIGWWRGGAEIALVVALAMVLIVLMGAVIGLALPFVLSRLGRDPATASGPLVTSIADVLGVLTYFGIAMILLDLG